MSDINKVIHILFRHHWVGDSVTKNIDTMRMQLYKNLKDQLNGYWSGSTAYHIMVQGGFLLDGKRGSNKKLTALGHIFVNSMVEGRS